MRVQITTECAGVCSPSDQRELLRQLRPGAASVAVREMLSDGDEPAARSCCREAAEAGAEIQRILYDDSDVLRLKRAVGSGTIPAAGLLTLLILGRYDRQSPARTDELAADHAVCAFGPAETEILRTVLRRGGKIRVGFENNLHMRDGRLAPDNAARVREVLSAE